MRMRVDGEPRRDTAWRQAPRLLATAGGLALTEGVLVGQLGNPTSQLRVLRQLGSGWADPVSGVLAAMTLLAEILVAYVLAVVVLRWLALVPGSIGRLADRVAFLVTPIVVRRALDLLVGGTLLAQATLAITPGTSPGQRSSVTCSALPDLAVAFNGSLVRPALTGPAGSGSTAAEIAAVAGNEPVETRPTPRRASVPMPPWLAGGPSNPTPEQGGTAQRGEDDRSGGGEQPGAGDRSGSGDQRPGTAERSGTDHQPGTRDQSGNRGQPGTRHRPRGGSGPGVDDGDRASAAGTYIIKTRDTLWDIAAAHLRPTDRSTANVHRYWQQVYRANRAVIGGDPDLIYPGTRLDLPPYRRDRP